MKPFLYLIYLIILVEVMILYLKLAVRYGVTDRPNDRSSHIEPTVRGGGIIFPLSILMACVDTEILYPFFLAGLILVSTVSFADDIKPRSNRLRITIHLLAVCLLFYQLGLFAYPWYLAPVFLVLSIGIVNAVNFMDGINGITGLYGIISLLSFFWINQYIQPGFIEEAVIVLPLLGLVVFGVFNFRKKALCFAGDVGSISLAFILIFLIGVLIVNSGDFFYLHFLLLYGLDAGTTIACRLIRGENIFEAHRSHFYQYLSNDLRIPHLLVSSGYAVTQLLINLLVLYVVPHSLSAFIGLAAGGLLVFVVVRWAVEGSDRLLKPTVLKKPKA